MDTQAKLMAQIEAFLLKTGLKPSAFGRMATNDSKLVFSLRNGRAPTTRVIDRIHAFMKSYRERRKK